MEDFYNFVFKLNSFKPHGWIYRGQSKDWKLSTAIERMLRGWAIDLTNATTIEFQTIREFRRRLRDPQYSRVHNDTLFCLALMQHHGAPTRLLDCSYSPFAAAAFAMEKRVKEGPVVWCFRQLWLENETREKTSNKDLLDWRNDDRQRTDDTFLKSYQLYRLDEAQSEPSVQFVKSENPFHLNERLTAQQGVFLCPADLCVSFADNLKAMSNWASESNVVKLRLELDDRSAIEFARNLKSMNLSFAALFPGLEGFARSIGQQMFHYHELAENRAGHPPRSE